MPDGSCAPLVHQADVCTVVPTLICEQAQMPLSSPHRLTSTSTHFTKKGMSWIPTSVPPGLSPTQTHGTIATVRTVFAEFSRRVAAVVVLVSAQAKKGHAG